MSAMTSHAQPTLRTGSPRRPLPARLTPLRRLRRIVVIALLLCFIPIFASYLSAVTGPSNSSFTIRSFEWLRDHGAAPVASQIESIYYSLGGPSTGGPALSRLPLSPHGALDAVHPPNIPPLIAPALPSEGVWVRAESWSGQSSPVQVTQFRTDPSYPQMVAGVAWINPARVRIQLYPGRLEPSVALPRGPMEVPPGLRSRLL